MKSHWKDRCSRLLEQTDDVQFDLSSVNDDDVVDDDGDGDGDDDVMENHCASDRKIRLVMVDREQQSRGNDHSASSSSSQTAPNTPPEIRDASRDVMVDPDPNVIRWTTTIPAGWYFIGEPFSCLNENIDSSKLGDKVVKFQVENASKLSESPIILVRQDSKRFYKNARDQPGVGLLLPGNPGDAKGMLATRGRTKETSYHTKTGMLGVIAVSIMRPSTSNILSMEEKSFQGGFRLSLIHI